MRGSPNEETEGRDGMRIPDRAPSICKGMKS